MRDFLYIKNRIMWDTNDTRVSETEVLPTPQEVRKWLELSEEMQDFVVQSRDTTSNILHWRDNRKIVIAWPCSIHNEESAIEYAKWLKDMQKQFDNLYFVMRVYFEKPRTTVWWKGLINDPKINGSFDIAHGLVLARKILYDITKLWVPIATEQLDTITPQYLSDLVSYSAIWARTTESQPHREMASGLSSPVWFKNWSSWDTKIAVDWMKASMNSHIFMWINEKWQSSRVSTKWNYDTHVILRWGRDGINYTKDHIKKLEDSMIERDVEPMIIVDASHQNSEWDFKNQIKVCKDVAKQIKKGNTSIKWVMLESHLIEWSQTVEVWKTAYKSINSNQSITDACIGIEDSQKCFNILNKEIGWAKQNPGTTE